MADGTHIEWTDATWNPITGCSVKSPGCANCYAMRLAGTRLRDHPSRVNLTRETKAGPVWTGEVRFNEAWLTEPLKWRRPRRIFVCAHADLFHEAVPASWIDKVFAVMALAPQHTFQVLTKRPERMRNYMKSLVFHQTRHVFDEACLLRGGAIGGYMAAQAINREFSHVWLGVSVEDQARADERIPILLRGHYAVPWVSAEPLLGEIDLRPWLGDLNWIVAGGESGPKARPMHPDWVRSLRDQCADSGVPFLFKQWGEWAPRWGRADGGELVARLGKKAAGRTLDGVIHDAYPEVLS